jgi:diguanylate cyclase (GGDEF)-like protein
MRRKILLIDDDRLQFRLTQAHFNNFVTDSYELEWASTYETGLEKLMSGAFAACLLDYQLGERDGLQLIREATGAGCQTPIIFLTAESGQRVDIAAMNAGALDYLVKGEITPRTVERSLRYALKLAETLDALRRLATRDQLTGLLNRREFERIMVEEEERAHRFGHPLALVMVDIDHFKKVNDKHGHPVGDLVLREVARRVAERVRTVDRVMRFGGEEIAVLLMQTTRAGAVKVARQICKAVETKPVPLGDGDTLQVTVSAGAAELPTDAETGYALLNAADRALYAAKKRGRNCAVGYNQV